MEWNDPLNSSSDSLILFLATASGTVLAKGIAATTGDGRPLEYLTYTSGSFPENDYFIIACKACSNPITFKLSGQGNGAAWLWFGLYDNGSGNGGQKVASGVVSSAAAWIGAQSPLSTTLSINREGYSASGPFLYGNYGATNTLSKPDLTGIDEVLVSGAGGFGIPNSSGGAIFCGTSAAAPNIGGLIAQLMQFSPGMPSSYYYSLLEQNANTSAFADITSGGCSGGSTTSYSQNVAGAGLAQGLAALNSIYQFPTTSIDKPISVANGQTNTYLVPLNYSVTYSASVQGGSNTATASKCVWSSNSAATQIGASVAYMATAVGTYQLVANCPDSKGYGSPTPPTIAVNAQTISAPTVAISNVGPSGFDVTLSGHQPLTVSATSSDSTVLPDNAITISPGCGISYFQCRVSLYPSLTVNGTTQITIKTTDQWNRSGTAAQSETYTYTPPSSGGGGKISYLCLLGLLSLASLSIFISPPKSNLRGFR